MVRQVIEILSVDNPVFTTYIAYSAILIVKFMLLAPYTAFHRLRTKVGISKIYNWLTRYQ